MGSAGGLSGLGQATVSPAGMVGKRIMVQLNSAKPSLQLPLAFCSAA
jgi:hypothetical protein